MKQKHVFENKSLVGLYEKVLVKGNNGQSVTRVARIDTGATLSSIDKELVEKLDLGPIIKQRLTKQASGETMRDVIKVNIELAGRKFNFRFSIADRSKMKYKILIGQNILKKDFIIDPLKK